MSNFNNFQQEDLEQAKTDWHAEKQEGNCDGLLREIKFLPGNLSDEQLKAAFDRFAGRL